MSASTTLRNAVRPARCHHTTPLPRTFSSSITRHQIQPESPRYLEVPEPPQQTLPPRPRVKGFLPVPRDLFPGKLKKHDNLHNSLHRTARVRRVRDVAAKGSREEWEVQLSAQRRRNLLEGSIELKLRQEAAQKRESQRTKEKIDARELALHQAMREDERLTMQSNNFDVEKLDKSTRHSGQARELALAAKARHEHIELSRYEQKQEHLHDLYNKARSFIVNKDQLDQAIETAFGTDEKPALFTTQFTDDSSSPYSVWNYGKPDRLQDRVNIARRRSMPKIDLGPSGSHQAELHQARITQIAEQLTGGSLGKNLLSVDNQSK